MTSNTSTTFCNKLKKLDISNLSGNIQATKRQISGQPPQVKELIEKAVANLEGQSGSKEDIIAMTEVLYPPLVNDFAMQRSLD